MHSLPCTVTTASTPRRLRTFFLAVVLGALIVPTAHAAWQPDGVLLSPIPPIDPQRSTTYSLGNLLADGSGGAYVTWLYSSYFSPSDATDLAFVAQRLDMSGNRPAPWTAAGSTIFSWVSSPGGFGITNAEPLALVPDGAGGAVHALVSASFVADPHNNFNLHHVQPNAIVTGFPGFTGDFSGGPSPAATAADGDGAGGVLQIVKWQTFAPPLQDKPPAPLTARRIAPDGSILWQNDAVVPPGQATGAVAVLGDGTGGGWFAWIDSREAGDPDVYVLRLTADGLPAAGWPATGALACGAPGPQFEPHLATRPGDGGVYVIWRDERDGTSRLYVQHFFPLGNLAPGMPADGLQLPSTDADDRFVTACGDAEQGLYVMRAGTTANVSNAHLHRLGVAANPMPGWPATGLTLGTLSFGGTVGLAADDQGGAYASFRNAAASPPGLYAQHFAGDASPAPGWTTNGVLLSATGYASRVVRSGAGAIVAWDDFRAGAPGVYAQRLVTDGPVATELALVEYSVQPDRVDLRWYAGGGAGLAVTVERRTLRSDWSQRMDTACDGVGQLRFVDDDVVPGEVYGYRVVWREDGARQVSAETWVTIPGGIAELALESPFPNPSSGIPSITLSVPDERPARLEIVDLAGRRIAARELSLGAGRHAVALDETRDLAPGLYLVRLSHGGESRVTRLLRAR